MSERLKGKVVLITGSGSGQGRAAAVLFAQEGARVVGCDINAEGLDETVRRVTAAGGEMVGTAPVDAADPEQAQAWVDEAARTFGRIDVLYNNAASVREAPMDAFPVEDWHYSMKYEIDIAFFPTRAAWPHLKENGGVIISTASTAGLRGIAGSVAHCTTKGAIIAMSRALAAEGAPYGIRAFSISPGPIRVEGTEAFFDHPGIKDKLISRVLMKRTGTPEEVAKAALFLASDESSFLTGVDVPIDGGMISWTPGYADVYFGAAPAEST